VLHSFGYIPRSGITGSCGRSLFRFLRFQIFFQSGCTSLHSQQWTRVPFSPYPHQYTLVVFLMMAILTGVKWSLSVVWICISYMARDCEQFFMCFWPFEFLLLRKFCLVQLLISLLVHWFWECLVFWVPCMFLLSVLCLMYSWQILSPTLLVVSSV
jgi:hypothetical protein